ncbi:hypothetical protein [Shimazuella alba]|uniref:Uncharacterized protein n=1 Tax=Shimazuella alba TaxID=2690964 RepID=A0A6I4VUC5_9BACL|nr:hypothetical protein [Shimazuella alba]MXQ54121.1 hypothetical protein [Shimazuella alba]
MSAKFLDKLIIWKRDSGTFFPDMEQAGSVVENSGVKSTLKISECIKWSQIE